MSAPHSFDGKDDKIAALLTQGATVHRIEDELHVSSNRIKRVRLERDIPLPPGRAKRPKTEIDASERQAIRMLREGATRREIQAATRISPNRIGQLRQKHDIPVPKRSQRQPGLTVDEAFARHTTPTDDGHLMWTGPRSGRTLKITINGTTHNARHIAFRKHHGRDPVAYAYRTCCVIGCIAGAHHADQTIRRNNLRTNP